MPASIPSCAPKCCETVSHYCTNFERDTPSPASSEILEPALLQAFPAIRTVNSVDLTLCLPATIGPKALTRALDGCTDAYGSPITDTHSSKLQPAPERNSRKTSAPAPGTTSSIIGGACARSSMVKSWDCGGGAQWRVTSRRHDAGEHSRYVEPGAAAIEYFVVEASRRATAF